MFAPLSKKHEFMHVCGFRFPIAIDADWATLRRWWLEAAPRRATSVSFLLDRDGVIRHVHPGPAYHREVVKGDTRPARDFAALERAIEAPFR